MPNRMNPDELRDRMNPDHLTLEDRKIEIQKQAEKAKIQEVEKEDPETNPRAQREYTFDFLWEDGNGKIWKGKFTNRVPNVETRALIGLLRAQLSNNIPFQSLDPMTQEINLVLAHLSFSLVQRPPWAEDLGSLFNFELVQRIYQEVTAHEVTFLGYAEVAAVSSEKY